MLASGSAEVLRLRGRIVIVEGCGGGGRGKEDQFEKGWEDEEEEDEDEEDDEEMVASWGTSAYICLNVGWL